MTDIFAPVLTGDELVAFGAMAGELLLDDFTPLLCPLCGEANLHHQGVVVYDRADSDAVVRVVTTDGRTTMSGTAPNEVSGNPSSRRGAICIDFFCEECHGTDGPGFEGKPFRLAVVQHKGTTYLEWVP